MYVAHLFSAGLVLILGLAARCLHLRLATCWLDREAMTACFDVLLRLATPRTVSTHPRGSGFVLPATEDISEGRACHPLRRSLCRSSCFLGISWPPFMKTVKPVVSKEEVITSRNHSLIKRVRRLHLRAERDKNGLFYAEGMRFVAQAMAGRAEIETALYCRALTNVFGRRLIRKLSRIGVPCAEVTAEVLQSLALVDDPQGIGIITRQRWASLESVDPHTGLCWIALETVQSPGNLGTIIRTAEAVGAAGLILLDHSIDAYHQATVRASMGALFSPGFRFIRTAPARFLRWKQRHGCTLVGTSPVASTVYHEVEYRAPVVLWMGGERKGLNAEQMADCDVLVRLPMSGHSDSLNLAVATGIMLYEVLRQRVIKECAIPEAVPQKAVCGGQVAAQERLSARS
jgi:TrmH family RNA methyltransferase